MQTLTTVGMSLLGSVLLLAPVSAQTPLTTTFAGGNSLNSPGSNLFDITVLNPKGIVITSIEVNCENTRNGPVGSQFDIVIYLTDPGGTYVGNQATPVPWWPVSMGTGTSLATGTPTPVDVDDFFVPPGTHGMAVHYNFSGTALGTAFTYTNGTGANQTYMTADVRLDLGSSSAGVFSGAVYDPRVWNGTILYEAGTVAAMGTYGLGCDGGSPNGVPTLAGGAANPTPVIGGLFDLEFGNLGPAPNFGIIIFGLTFQQWGPFSLPVDLAMFGLPGCQGYVPPDSAVFFGHNGGSFAYPIQVPNDPALPGLGLGMQALLPDPMATNAAAAKMTNLLAGRVGT